MIYWGWELCCWPKRHLPVQDHVCICSTIFRAKTAHLRTLACFALAPCLLSGPDADLLGLGLQLSTACGQAKRQSSKAAKQDSPSDADAHSKITQPGSQVPAFLPLLEGALRLARICSGWDFGCCYLAPASILRRPAQGTQDEPLDSIVSSRSSLSPSRNSFALLCLSITGTVLECMGKLCNHSVDYRQRFDSRVVPPALMKIVAVDCRRPLCSQAILFLHYPKTIGPGSGRSGPLSQSSFWIRNPSPLSCRSPSKSM